MRTGVIEAEAQLRQWMLAGDAPAYRRLPTARNSIAETAAASGLPEGAVKVAVHRAVKSLHEEVGRNEN